MPFLSVEEVEQYLAAIPKFQSDHTKATDFNLSKFEDFCKELGNPQNDFSSIHVAGTNGKGSTCRILAGVYRQAGYSVGCYTSPHMIQFNERFVINGRSIPDKALLSFFRQYHALIEAHKLTYFEISTAIAFWWFSKRKIDLGIIETGLGGRLDATNIIRPLVSVITSISLDHTDILGDSLREIAQEKGGIIKSGRPVVLGNLPEEAESTIRRIAEGRGSAVITIKTLRPEMTQAGDVTLRDGEKEVHLKTPLQAPVQARNVAIVWQVIKVVNSHFRVSEGEFRSGIQHAAAGHGRFEKLLEKKRWYFDGAHNIEAVQGVKQSVSTVGEVDEAILVLSLMRDKITSEVMNEFSEFKNIYYYSLNTERAAPLKEIRRWLPQVMAFPTQPDHQKRLFKEFDSELVIFAGSFYFYTTVRDWIKTLD